MQDRAALLRSFADRLEELRLAAGGPSYADLVKLSRWLKRSTISDVLRARSNPSLDFVVAFVTACRSYARSHMPGPDLGAFDVDTWRQAWLQLQRRLGALRRSHPPAAGARQPDAPEHSKPVPRQLPPAPRPFIGREPYLGALDSLLKESPDRPTAGLVVDGAAGVGKTALVVHWAHQVRHQFPDGDLYLDLRGYAAEGTPLPAGQAIRTLLHALQVPLSLASDDLDYLSVLWRSVLAGRRVLVVLDNAISAAQVRPLLPGAGKSAVVITSRRRLSGLIVRDGVTAFHLARMTQAESGRLMYAVIGNSAAEEPDAVHRLAHLCDHNPLAMRILAERVVVNRDTLPRVLQDLTGSHPLSALATPDDDPAAAVRTVLGWSYQALPDHTARTFRLLSLHPGPRISAGAVAALAGAPPEHAYRDLSDLEDIHLVSRTEPARFQMHDLVGHLSVELLDAIETPVEKSDAARREILWYLHTAAEADRLLMPGRRAVALDPAPGWLAVPALPTYEQAVDWCDAERDCFVGIVRRAHEQRRYEACWQLPTLLLSYLNLRKAWAEWIACFDIATSAARQLRDRYAEATCANALGIAYRELRHYDAALDHLRTAATLFRELGIATGEAYALNNISVIFQNAPHRGVAILRRALALARSAGFTPAEVTVLHNLGEAYAQLGQFDKALACASQCLQICERTGDRAGVGFALGSLGEIYARQRRSGEALRYLQAAVTVRKELRDLQGEAVIWFRMGRALADAGDLTAGRDCLRRARQMLETIGDPLTGDVRALQRRL